MSDIIEHLPVLERFCLNLNAKKVLELGVRDGESTKAFLKALDITDGKLISVDINNCSGVSNSGRWQFVQTDDTQFDFNEVIDILFIDSSHAFQHTLFELNKFGDLVRAGGVILLHDTNMQTVMDAILEYLKTHPNYKFINLKNCNGLGILEKT